MNQINPEKLMHSKWTAATPRNREKHFLVINCERDEEDKVIGVEIEALLTRRTEVFPWQELQNARQWQMGWL